MTLKPPTRPLPKLVMKDWPEKEFSGYSEYTPITVRSSTKALSDFTRVVEETGILDQERSQKDSPPSNEGSCTKSGDR